MCLAQDSVSPRARRRAYVRGPALQILEKLLGVYEAFPLTVAEAACGKVRAPAPARRSAGAAAAPARGRTGHATSAGGTRPRDPTLCGEQGYEPCSPRCA
jgi:hypothetical protein